MLITTDLIIGDNNEPSGVTVKGTEALTNDVIRQIAQGAVDAHYETVPIFHRQFVDFNPSFREEMETTVTVWQVNEL